MADVDSTVRVEPDPEGKVEYFDLWTWSRRYPEKDFTNIMKWHGHGVLLIEFKGNSQVTGLDRIKT